MSSREIADLVGSRHDKVKQSIERLAQRGTIVQPPMGDEHNLDTTGRSRATEVYLLGKRDSYVVVAQLSPEFTGDLVDRWQELEAQQTLSPILALHDPGTLRALLLGNVEERMKLAHELAATAPKLDAYDRIARAEGSLCITDAAKNLQVRPKSLFDFLRAHGWIYQPHGGRGDIAYAAKLQQRLMEHKMTTVRRSDGSEKIITQARITPKGLTRLAQEFPSPAKLAA